MDYRPPRESAALDDDGAPHESLGFPQTMQPAVLPPATTGPPPMAKPRNKNPPPPMEGALTPNVIQPEPYPHDYGHAPTPNVLQPDPSLRNDAPAPAPHVIQPNSTPAGAEPPPYNNPQQGALPPYQLQPGAAPVQQSGTGGPNKMVPADFRVKVKSSYTFFTTWRGIVEIIARAAVMVVAVIAFALSPVIIGTINANEYLDIILTAGSINPLLEEAQVLIKGSENVAGFMIFLSITCFIVQIPTIVGRFILRCGTTLLFVLHIADAVVSGILAVFFLSGAMAAAVYAGQWSEPPQVCTEGFIDTIKEIFGEAGISTAGITFSCEEDTLSGQLGGLALFGFIGLGLTGFLVGWTIYAMKVKWDTASNGYQEDTTEANVK